MNDGDKDLVQFLAQRKFKLLESERQAKGKAKYVFFAQIQVIDLILTFLSQKETTDMESLKLALDKQAIPLSEIKRKVRTGGVTDALIKIAEELQPGTGKSLDTSKIKPKSLVAKVYQLKKKGRLPANIRPITVDGGKEVYLAKE